MQVRVLGCSGAIAQGCRTTSFLLNQHILIDAGTGVGDLPVEEMLRIDHVLLSHSHLDHIAALPLMLDALGGQRNTPVTVHALPATIAALQQHIFNDVVWPDFSVLPSPQAPFLRYAPIDVGQRLLLAGCTIEVLPAAHTVPAVGFAVQGDQGWWVYSGDTGPNPALWERINRLPVAALVIETAFSSDDCALAARSLHLSPPSLVQELQQWRPQQPCPVYITHTKPLQTQRILEEIHQLDPTELGHSIHWLHTGQTLHV